MAESFTFLPVMYYLAEPRVRLWVAAHASREYEHGSFEIDIKHDPELRADALLRPTDESSRRSWARVNREKPAPEWEPNESSSATSLVRLSLTHQLMAGEVRLVMDKAYNDFGLRAAKLEQALDLGTAAAGFELLHEALKASVHLPIWDYQAQTEVRDLEGELLSGPLRTRVAFYLERELALALAEASSFRFDEDCCVTDSDYVLLAQRDLPVA